MHLSKMFSMYAQNPMFQLIQNNHSTSLLQLVGIPLVQWLKTCVQRLELLNTKVITAYELLEPLLCLKQEFLKQLYRRLEVMTHQSLAGLRSYERISSQQRQAVSRIMVAGGSTTFENELDTETASG